MILVTGATGRVGQDVVGGLHALGCQVAGLVRNPATANSVLPRVAHRIADYDDPDTLKRAFAGIDELVFISSDGDANSVARHHAKIIEAAEATGVQHIVFTSIIDCEASSPFYFAPVYRDSERRLLGSGISCTILRSGLYSDFIVENWLKPAEIVGKMMLPTGGGRVAPISRKDLAAAIVVLAARPRRGNNCYMITGRSALSFAQIAAVYERVYARPMRYRPCSNEDYLLSVSPRLHAPWPLAFSTLGTAIAEGRWGTASLDFNDVTSRNAETFSDFLIRTRSP
jgi:NAD(P)H dehydrogenase (quinone)